MSQTDDRVLHEWSARKLQPIILVYVATVFIVMMAVAHLVVHSPAAVKALALTAIACIVPLVPGATSKVEYRLTAAGLEQRPLNRKAVQKFKDVFDWQQLSHVVPVRNGFKYFKRVHDSGPLKRFWMTHISDAYSGEFHVEPDDRGKILDILARHEVPSSRP